MYRKETQQENGNPRFREAVSTIPVLVEMQGRFVTESQSLENTHNALCIHDRASQSLGIWASGISGFLTIFLTQKLYLQQIV